MLAVMGVAFGAMVARLVYVQGLASHRFAAAGLSQLVHDVVTPPQRGSISGRDGQVLAMSVPETTIVADPYQVADPSAEAAALAPVLHQDRQTLQAELSENAGFVYLARQVDASVAAKVKALHLGGLTFQSEPKSFATGGAVDQPLLGLVGVDGHGLSGLQYEKDALLSGRPGRLVLERGPDGADIPGGVRSSRPALAGQSLVLTLDQPLQYEVTQALAAQIQSTHAKDGTAVVTDPRTGAVLAMVDLVAGADGGPPTPAPSNFAVTHVYEPGSVMKLATLAAALGQHLVTPDQTFTVPGSYRLGAVTFHDAEPHGTESLSVSQIIVRSSNIGTTEIAQLLGKSGLDRSLRNLGFGSPTGLGYPGESAGILRSPSTWSASAIGDVAIGQDEAATALQVLDAYNAVADGGVLVPPHLVSATVGPSGHRHAVEPRPGRRVLSTETAKEVNAILQQVVTSAAGTAPAASVPGYSVAGKTGTAQIPRTDGPGYQPGAFMATFVGYVPAEDPALSAVVVLDQPDTIYGGSAAAPVFSQIAQFGLRQLDVPPSGAVATAPATRPVQPPSRATAGHSRD